MPEGELLQWLTDWVSAALGGVAIDVDARLDELGLSSRDAVALAGELEDVLDRVVPPTLAWEFPSLRAVAHGLLGGDAETAAAATTPAPAPHPLEEPIAIVGVGCRLPGDANGPEGFWTLLREGRDAIGEVPAGRWAESGSEDPTGEVPRLGGFLGDVAGFDAEAFGITPREAALTDPQQRLLLEVAAEAFAHARIDLEGLRGSDTGVFVGISASEYGHLTGSSLAEIEPWTATGAALSIAANRLSYALDLHGPSMAVDTACSSSLVALHTACASLRAGESSAALVGGVNLLLTPLITASFDRAGALAEDGRCKSFGAGADGIGRGEGCGVVVLRRLSDAVAAGDRILALVVGSAVNSDGRSNGLTAPNPQAQEAVLRRAYERCGVDPTTVDYVEAHGTGTLLGDPIEAAALGRVLGAGREPGRPLLLGSVKSNIGHLEAAAGIAAVIKVALSLSRDQLPPSLHASETNPHIDLTRDHLEVVGSPRGWPRYAGVARAGVSGFGFGGTNAHVVLEQAPAAVPPPEPPVGGAPVLALSAASDDRLVAVAADLADWLETPAAQPIPLQTIARSVARHRSRGAARTVVAAADRAELVRGLRAVTGGVPRTAAASPVWVFSGYGQQWTGMARGLMAAEPAFASAVADVQRALAPHTSLDLEGALDTGTPVEGVADTMTAIFGLQVGLAALWRSFGVVPAAVIGHSLGEVAAAVVAGGLDLADGARVITSRGRLLQGLDNGAGAMCVVDAGPDEIAALAGRFPGLEIAVAASPVQCTVAGPREQVDALAAHLESTGRDAWPLRVGGAGHSAAVDPVLPALRSELADVRGVVPRTAFYSTVSLDPRSVPAFDADYWAQNARGTVRFAAAVAAARADGLDTFVEISAHPTAARALTATLSAAGGSFTVVTSLRRDAADTVEIARAVALLHAAGHPTVLAERWPDGPECDLPAPTWRHTRHWFTPAAAAARPTVGQPAVSPVLALGQALSLPGAGLAWTHERAEDLLAPWAGSNPLGTAAIAALATEAAVRVLGAGAAVEPLSVARVPGVAMPARASLLVAASGGDTGGGHTAIEVNVHLRPAGSDGAWVLVGQATIGRTDVTAVPDLSAVPAPVPAITPLAPTAAERDWREEARAGAPGGQELVRDRLLEVIAEIMGYEAGDVDPTTPLTDLGLDSLMATRAQHAVERDFGVPLPIRLLLRGMSLDGLAAHLVGQLVGRVPEQRHGNEEVAPIEPPTRPLVPARTACERFLVGLCLDLLRVAVGVTDELTDHGFGVVEAQQLEASIAHRVGRSPSSAELLAAGTLESIAELIGPDFDGHVGDTGSVVRVLREGVGLRPLFLFHPAGGPTTVYQPLVAQLDPELPVIGLERLPEIETVEGKAAAYLALIRERQPVGPYRLMGWSLGGLLAVECAQQLAAVGERVELLASIDTILPRLDPEGDPDTVLIERYRRFTEHVSQTYGAEVSLPDDFAGQDELGQLEAIRTALDDAGIRLPPGVLLHQYTSYTDARIAERYVPAPYAGELVLYRAASVDALTTSLDPRYLRSDAALGWDAHVVDLVVVPVPGNHITMIDRPNVDVLAGDLRSRLAELDWASGLFPAGTL